MIELKGITHQYRLDKKNTHLALDRINLSFKEGEFVAIIGPNGSGKTTLARLLNGLILPSEGKVFVDGLDTAIGEEQKKIRLLVGMVFQNPDNQFISTTVEREIAFGLENLALPREKIGERVKWAFSTFGLEELRNHPPHKLSGGEKQKVALASVLTMRPKYLVLDEPTSFLDPKGKEELNLLIKNLSDISHTQEKLTILHITQFPEEALYAERILVLDQGKVFLDGKPYEVFHQVEDLKRIGLGIPLFQEILYELKKSKIRFEKRLDNINDLIAELKNKKKDDNTVQQSLDLFSQKEIKLKDKELTPRIIRVKDLSFVYNQNLPQKKKALHNINFEIEKGDLLGIIGPTGSGKSTLIQHFNGLLFPTEGEVVVDDIKLTRNNPKKNIELKRLRKMVGLCFQFPELQLFEETVFDDVAFGPKNLSLPENEIKDRVKQALDLVGLDFKKFASRSPHLLSEGEKRKVAIAGIIAMDPEIVVLDEPTCGLDKRGTEDIKKLLRKLSSQRKTIILVSHDIDLVVEIVEKIILLESGKLIHYGRKENLFKDLKDLRSYGLGNPLILDLVKKLKMNGFRIEPDIFTREKLIQKLLTLKKMKS